MLISQSCTYRAKIHNNYNKNIVIFINHNNEEFTLIDDKGERDA